MMRWGMEQDFDLPMLSTERVKGFSARKQAATAHPMQIFVLGFYRDAMEVKMKKNGNEKI